MLKSSRFFHFENFPASSSLALGAMLLLGTLHVSGCGDDGGETSGGTTGGQQTTSSSSGGGTPGSSSSSGADPGTTSASAGGGDGGSNPAGTGGADPAGTGGSDPAGTGGTGGAGTGGGGDGGSLPESGLPPAPGAGNVPKPAGAVGGFKVIDWAGFTGAVSYSFDDSNSSQISNYDALNGLGVPFTFYLQTGKQESNNAVWTRALMDGHELANHTQSHRDNDDGSDTDAATKFIRDKFGIEVYTMAAPNGSSVYTNIAKTRFMINRGVSNAVIAPRGNADPFTLPSYIPPANASASVMDAEITSARAAKGWRTFCIHGFSGGSDGAYNAFPLQSLLDHVKKTKDLGDMWIDSIVNVGAYWLGQKAIPVNGTASGSDTTWTWTLPAHFPPGKYVRVTVTGGTLKQNGAPLKWDPHGYYEVALDAKSVTLSP
ncbi:put. Polysaccharide deacetylase [Sorangium cellulosum So ce56]|uniref:Put. Polysaccharide deacetylase n=2 Tax=Sorangium cellulosum TaxID=56 RepID=A9GY13_SORC5|nr:put. Polysaccharide deacetylase [Sorangium cellulosum So ce56]